jgi:hypothetical protein
VARALQQAGLAELTEQQRGALDVARLKKLIFSIHSTVSLGHQTGPHAYAGEDFGIYLAEAARDCREIMGLLAALAARQPGAQEPFAGALEETRVRDLRESFDVAHRAFANPAARIPSDEWGGRKDMMCPDDEDEGLDFNRSGWSAEVMAFGPLGVRPEDSIVLTASAAAVIQQVLMELLQAATAAPPAQGIDLTDSQAVGNGQ